LRNYFLATKHLNLHAYADNSGLNYTVHIKGLSI
jgi:hypothetical protein